MLFFVADAAYDSQYIYEIARICNIFNINPINPRNGEQIKSTHRRVLSHFVQTIFDKQWMKEHGKLEQQFSEIKVELLPLNDLAVCLKWKIPANIDITISYLSRIFL